MSYSYNDFILDKGISLSDLGLQERALTRSDAVLAIVLLEEDLIPVLGGDVYFRCGAKIEVAYANWYSNSKQGEGSEDFSARSCKEALEYIQGFPSKADREPIFTFVLRARPD